jgi:hypothetical protein
MLFQVKTGSEWHTTERRSSMVTVGGKPIYQVLKPLSSEWEDIGNKGKHGKWCVSEYEIPMGSHVVFKATANGRPNKIEEFIVSEKSINVDIDGYMYGNSICGWIISLGLSVK